MGKQVPFLYCIVDKDRYLWAVARYIEQNPARARTVQKAEDFPYSSATAHINGVRDEILGEDLFEERRRRTTENLLNQALRRRR